MKAKQIITKPENIITIPDKILGKAEVKWCNEAERRSDRSLLLTYAKMKSEPQATVREYHWIMFNEMCFRNIQDNPTPSVEALKSGIKTPEPRKPAAKKDFGPGWIEGAIVRFNRTYGGVEKVEGIIERIWNDNFPYDMDVRIKPQDASRPGAGVVGVMHSEVMLLPSNHEPINYYKPIQKIEIITLPEFSGKDKKKAIRV
jgi:hypothetical protein